MRPTWIRFCFSFLSFLLQLHLCITTSSPRPAVCSELKAALVLWTDWNWTPISISACTWLKNKSSCACQGFRDAEWGKRWVQEESRWRGAEVEEDTLVLFFRKCKDLESDALKCCFEALIAFRESHLQTHKSSLSGVDSLTNFSLNFLAILDDYPTCIQTLLILANRTPL